MPLSAAYPIKKKVKIIEIPLPQVTSSLLISTTTIISWITQSSVTISTVQSSLLSPSSSAESIKCYYQHSSVFIIITIIISWINQVLLSAQFSLHYYHHHHQLNQSSVTISTVQSSLLSPSSSAESIKCYCQHSSVFIIITIIISWINQVLLSAQFSLHYYHHHHQLNQSSVTISTVQSSLLSPSSSAESIQYYYQHSSVFIIITTISSWITQPSITIKTVQSTVPNSSHSWNKWVVITDIYHHVDVINIYNITSSPPPPPPPPVSWGIYTASLSMIQFHNTNI